MTKLSFDYDDATGDYIATYRGLTIKAQRDSDAESPWGAWDCQPPLITVSGDRHGGLDVTHADGADTPLDGMSPHWISRNWRAIAKALDLDAAAHDKDAKEVAAAYGGLGAARADLFKDALGELGDYGSKSDYLSALAALWTVRGVQTLETCSTGYSQGDYADLLLVATPAWLEAIGNGPDYDAAPSLASAAKLWGAWAWGDVYGYVIGEDGDSCWGYYGTDFDESGLAEAATSAADGMLADAAKRRGDCLKTLIRNRVPLALRPALLASAGTVEGDS